MQLKRHTWSAPITTRGTDQRGRRVKASSGCMHAAPARIDDDILRRLSAARVSPAIQTESSAVFSSRCTFVRSASYFLVLTLALDQVSVKLTSSAVGGSRRAMLRGQF
jgi:hypothetical protein